MSRQINTRRTVGPVGRRSSRWHRVLATVLPVTALAAGCAATDAASPPTKKDVVQAAMLATASYQDVEIAEASGYASSIDTLGCFQRPGRGGMGLHFINAELMDATVDVTKPEALVDELDWNPAVRLCPANVPIVGTDLPAPNR